MRQVKLLYFTDNKEASKNFSALCEASGYSISYFSDAKEFIGKFKQEIPFICLIDLDTKSNLEARALMKSLRNIYGNGLMICCLTQAMTNPLVAVAQSIGINEILLKNLDEKTFQAGFKQKVAKLYFNEKVSTTSIPKIIEWYFETISPQLAVLGNSLESIDELETRVNFYVDKLLPHREPFLGMVKALSKKADKLEFNQAVRLFGVDNARTLLSALTLAEVVKSEAFKWNPKTGQLTMDAKLFVPYAFKAVTVFAEDANYIHLAFNVGLLFDFLNQLNETSKTKNPALKKYIEARFDYAIGKVKAGLKRAQGVKDLSLVRHILTYFLLKEAGRIGMALFNADYIDLTASLEKAEIKSTLSLIAERQKYSVTHQLIGSLLCQILPGTGEAAHSVLFSEQPYLLNNDASDHNHYTLVKFCEAL